MPSPLPFHDELRGLMKEYAHQSYKLTKSLPKADLYGLGSQLRRSSISVGLNYTEGFARRKKKSYLHFLEIAYGSLKESQFLLAFVRDEGLVKLDEERIIFQNGEHIARMLWSLIIKIEQECSSST